MADRPALTADELTRLCDFLYRRTGLALDEAKRYFVERRVADRMIATGTVDFAGYFERLRLDYGGEIEQFINSFTVNETYFYREDHQLAALTAHLLPARVAGRPKAALRIWSVPCSTGDEPYSVAMWLLENWREVDAHDIEIVGSDIDTAVLARARAGIFGRRALMRLDPALVARWFVQLDEERWQIVPALRDSVRFGPVNLVDPASMRGEGRFDVIFCRNVLIYFDDVSRRLAAENLFDALVPGGFLCLGHAESMSRISPLFEVVRTREAVVYRRPEAFA